MKFSALMLLTLLLLGSAAATRNPFVPVITPCDALLEILDKWQLKGVVSSPQGSIALMRSPDGAWRRVKNGQALISGTQLTIVDPQRVTLALGDTCSPPLYGWTVKGGHYGRDISVNSSSDSAGQ